MHEQETTSSAGAQLQRRRVLAGLGAAALMVAGVRTAMANGRTLEQASSEVLGSASAESGRIKLQLPEIAENGNTVPLKFSVESPMTADDYVKSVHVFAAGNPLPDVAAFHFTPRSGKASAAIRMRLAKTQDVVAIAEMSDGSFFTAKQEVKVTIGGCGG